MKRVIVDYAKLTNEILNLLVEKFPDGFDDSDIIRFRNAKNELIEAVEVRSEDTVYLVKVSTKLADRIENFDEDEEIDDVVEPINGIEIDEDDEAVPETDDEEEEEDDDIDKPELDPDDDEDKEDNEDSIDEDEDEEDDY